MSSPTPPPAINHILLFPVNARSHLRLLLQLSLNLILLHPSARCSFVVSSKMTELLQQEKGLHPAKLWAKVRERWRDVVVDIGEVDPAAGILAEDQGLQREVGPILEGLIEGAESWPRPCLAISDTFRVWVRSAIRALDTSIPVLQFSPTMALATHRFYRTTEDGGSCQGMVDRYEQNVAAGISDDDAAKQAFRFIEDRLYRWPDLPPMYDYEFTPQADSRKINSMVCRIQKIVYTSSRDTDGWICVSVPELDGDSLDAVSHILGVPTFGIGPQFSESVWSAAQEEQESAQAKEEDHKVMDFLDKALQTYGKDAAAYISFGSSFWPTLRPQIIDAILDSLMALDPPMPFVWATASPEAKISDEVKCRVEESGRGLIVDFAPQVKLLRHDAVGVYLTHCGVGSITETILCGVPIITLPFAADQPALASHFTQINKIGVPLHQLQLGNDRRQLGCGVVIDSTPNAMREDLRQAWETMRGPERQVFVKEVERIRDVFRQSWEKGGSRESMMRLSRYFTA